MINEQDEIYIDLSRVWEKFKETKIVCFCITIVCILACLIISYFYNSFLLTPNYDATGRILISWEPSKELLDNNTNYASSLNQKLLNNSVEIIKSEKILNEVSNKINNIYDVKELQKMISVSLVSNTDVINVCVTSNNPLTSKEIANEIINVFQKEAKK